MPLDLVFFRLVSLSSTWIFGRMSGVVNTSTERRPPIQHAEQFNPTLVDLAMTYGALSHLYTTLPDPPKPLIQLEPHFDQNDFN